MSMTATGIRSISTGSAPLDAILGGGIPQGSLLVLAGSPGTGKTVFAQQTIFANATAERPALYLTTYSEPLPKVTRYLQEFGFYDDDTFSTAVAYRDLGQRIREKGPAEFPVALAELLDERPYEILVVDSFKALHDLAGSAETFRLAVFDAAAHLAATRVTSVWIGEYEMRSSDDYPEFAIADGVITMENRPRGVRDERSLRVAKMRGRAPLPGEHTFRITSAGLEVFPRLAEAEEAGQAQVWSERIASGVPGLDALLGGGLYRGTATLVVGPTGAGKTMLGLGFLAGGHEAGERALLLTTQEERAKVEAILRRFPQGDELREPVTSHHRSPIEADLVDIAMRVKEEVTERGVRRLVIDGLGDLEAAAIDPGRLRAVLFNLVNFCSRAGVTVLLNVEADPSTGLPLLATPINSMMDTIIELRRSPGQGRSLTVLKSRASQHEEAPHKVSIDAAGIRVLRP